uniref:Uncharacterized protein n=1 Tax=Glossina morsitans morsitans TaxID=37546 RepID=A0ABK9NGE2_GLOMM
MMRKKRANSRGSTTLNLSKNLKKLLRYVETVTRKQTNKRKETNLQTPKKREKTKSQKLPLKLDENYTLLKQR